MGRNLNLTKRSFFDLLALADVERVHSSVIGWLLSDDCEALTIEQRSAALNTLFGIGETSVYKTISMKLEWEHIDILWLTEDEHGGKACWVLENKIKSAQHSDQLNQYAKKIAEALQSEYKEHLPHFCFLTIVGERAKSSHADYHNITYSGLVDILSPYFEGDLTNTTDRLIASEYFKTIRRMTEVTQAFLAKPQDFERVFLDGNKGMTAKMKLYSNERIVLNGDALYIAERGMETLMQKHYLLDVIREIETDLNAFAIKWWHVGETRGNADMGFHFEDYQKAGEDKAYHFDLSFQAGTFKFAVSYNYSKADSKDPNVRCDFIQRWEGIFLKLKEKYKCSQINRGRSRSRISISYSIEPKAWYAMPREAFVAVIKQELAKATQIKDEAIEAYKQKQ